MTTQALPLQALEKVIAPLMAVLPVEESERLVSIPTRFGTVEFDRAQTLTLPKGAVDMGESMRDACNRELQEEIGFGAREFIYLRKVSLSPSYMRGGIDLVLVRDLYPSKLEGDEPEPLELVPWPIDKIHELYARDDFSEGRAIAALAIMQEYLAGRFEGTPI